MTKLQKMALQRARSLIDEGRTQTYAVNRSNDEKKRDDLAMGVSEQLIEAERWISAVLDQDNGR